MSKNIPVAAGLEPWPCDLQSKGLVTHRGRIDDARPAHWKSEKVMSQTFVRIWEKLASGHRMHSVLLATARTQGVCSMYVWHWSSTLRACLASFWRVHSCVELRTHFWACSKSPDAHSEWRRIYNLGPTLVQRWSSALAERMMTHT